MPKTCHAEGPWRPPDLFPKDKISLPNFKMKRINNEFFKFQKIKMKVTHDSLLKLLDDMKNIKFASLKFSDNFILSEIAGEFSDNFQIILYYLKFQRREFSYLHKLRK
jgi:hypothetical protein